MDKPATVEDAKRVQVEVGNPSTVPHKLNTIGGHVWAAALCNERAERAAEHEPRYPCGYRPGASTLKHLLGGSPLENLA